jgi:hypothetical protein
MEEKFNYMEIPEPNYRETAETVQDWFIKRGIKERSKATQHRLQRTAAPPLPLSQTVGRQRRL